MTVVVAAGNGSTDTAQVTPAAYPEVITVSAIADIDGLPGGLGEFPAANCPEVYPSDNQLDDAVDVFSNYGAAVDLAAPGVCITTTHPGGLYGEALAQASRHPMSPEPPPSTSRRTQTPRPPKSARHSSIASNQDRFPATPTPPRRCAQRSGTLTVRRVDTRSPCGLTTSRRPHR